MKKSLGPKTIAFPTPVWLVGSYDAQGKPNAMTVAWGGICASSPPCVMVSIRKVRHSYDSIMTRKAFTISIPSEKYTKEADFFGIASGKHTDKFKDTGLTPVKSGIVDAPYIAEFPVVLECRLIQTHELGTHTLFIGEILDVKADQETLGPNGFPDEEKVRPILFGPGLLSYHGVGSHLGQAYSVGKNPAALKGAE